MSTPTRSKLMISTMLGAPSIRRFLPNGWDSDTASLVLKTAQARGPRGQVFVRGVEAFLLAIAVCFSLGAGTSSERYNDLSHRMMCTCSCSQLLGECNHVGCPSSGPMLRELSAAIASGATDKEILASFTAKYGATVLAAPTTHGFDLVAWVAPIAVFAAALLGTILLVRHWSIGRTAVAMQTADPTIDALRERIRRETDSGTNGGL